jgi:hypothetical protein
LPLEVVDRATRLADQQPRFVVEDAMRSAPLLLVSLLTEIVVLVLAAGNDATENCSIS